MFGGRVCGDVRGMFGEWLGNVLEVSWGRVGDVLGMFQGCSEDVLRMSWGLFNGAPYSYPRLRGLWYFLETALAMSLVFLNGNKGFSSSSGHKKS